MIDELRVLRQEYKLDQQNANNERFEELKKKYQQTNISNLTESQRQMIASTHGSHLAYTHRKSRSEMKVKKAPFTS